MINKKNIELEKNSLIDHENDHKIIENNEINENKIDNQLKIDLVELKEKFLLNKIKSEQEIKLIQGRMSKEIKKAYDFSLEKIITSLLPIVDNLERAINLHQESNSKIQLIINPIKLILSNFLNLLLQFNVTVINQINIPFDPKIHQAMSMVCSENLKENYIVNVMQNGYLLNNRLLRAAMVIVSK